LYSRRIPYMYRNAQIPYMQINVFI
jgi:hypothetical protein